MALNFTGSVDGFAKKIGGITGGIQHDYIIFDTSHPWEYKGTASISETAGTTSWTKNLVYSHNVTSYDVVHHAYLTNSTETPAIDDAFTLVISSDALVTITFAVTIGT